MDHDKIVAPAFVEKFQCIGPDCEDSCCRAWRISLDREDYIKLESAMVGDAKSEARFLRGVQRYDKPSSESEYAYLIHKQDGDCAFLDPETQLCVTHRDHGPVCLNKVCSTYPRRFAQIGQQLAMSLSISCPEAARLCLLDDQAMSSVDIDFSELADRNFLLTTSLSKQEGDALFFGHAEPVREVINQLLAFRDYSLASRLLFGAFFINRLVGYGEQGVSAQQLADEIDQIASPDVMATLHQQLADAPDELARPMAAVVGFLISNPAQLQTDGWAFTRILRAAWAQYGVLQSDELVFPIAEDGGLYIGEVIKRYQQNRDRMQPIFGERLDRCLENYCRNYWFSEAYDISPLASERYIQLLVRVATLRFLLIGQPALQELVAEVDVGKGPSDDQVTRFEAIVVDVFYAFSRGFEHDNTYKRMIGQTVQQYQMHSLAHQLLFLKV